jgi:lipopolysaccharide/colanic/teichoic acid biosynthesis glycosyltransferase
MNEKINITIEEAYSQSKHKKNYNGFYQLIFKRIVDIVSCLIGLPFVLIILLPAMIAIKVEDGGPIFYKSKRLGKGLKEFNMLKLRSMKVNAPDLRNDDGSTYNSMIDSRVTRVGHFLRETSIDELPQIFNVLIGQMSVIGPRAGDIESKGTYNEDEKDKLLIRPGISGYTQAYYRNNMGVRDKRLLDAWYAHNVSMLLDIKIVFKTMKTVINHENLYTNTNAIEDGIVKDSSKK